MEQAVWLLGLLCLQVCLLSTTALPGPDRQTAALQTNQAMEGSSPVIPGSLSQSSRTKRQTEAKGKCKNGCHSHIGAMSGLSRMPRPPPSWNSSDKKQEKERSECKKNREMCRSRIGAMGVMSGPPGPVRDTPSFQINGAAVVGKLVMTNAEACPNKEGRQPRRKS